MTDDPPDKTIGTYWPYATTLFDFTRRSMPMNTPGDLTNDELYAVTAYILYLNNIINEVEEMNAITLPKVFMPNRNGFINVYEQKKISDNKWTHWPYIWLFAYEFLLFDNDIGQPDSRVTFS